MALEHREACFPFGRACRLGEIGLDNETMPIIDDDMPHKREFGFLAPTLTIEPGLRIGCRLMGVVTSLLAMEVHRRVAWIVSIGVGWVGSLGLKALLACPGLDERPVDGEVII